MSGAGSRATVLGCDIDRLTMEQTIERCADIVETDRYVQHMAINAAKLVTLQTDEQLRDIINGCGLVNADGQAVVWASRLLRDPLPERVAGIDLMHGLVALAARRGWPVFFLGARQDVLERALEILRRENPGLVIAGQQDGYFGEDETGAVCDEIRASGARMLFVAMSSPRKEYFLGAHGASLQVPLVMGVGGAIDVVAGVTRRAPERWQRLGLEWAYRLLQEPRRMAGRYARTNTRFVLLVARARLRRRSQPVDTTA